MRHNCTWGYSSAGRALEWHSRGQRFDPAYLHQKEVWKTCFHTKTGLFSNFFGWIDIPRHSSSPPICTRMVSNPHFFHRMNDTPITTYFPWNASQIGTHFVFIAVFKSEHRFFIADFRIWPLERQSRGQRFNSAALPVNPTFQSPVR